MYIRFFQQNSWSGKKLVWSILLIYTYTVCPCPLQDPAPGDRQSENGGRDEKRGNQQTTQPEYRTTEKGACFIYYYHFVCFLGEQLHIFVTQDYFFLGCVTQAQCVACAICDFKFSN